MKKKIFLNLFMTQRFMSYINTPLFLYFADNTAEKIFSVYTNFKRSSKKLHNRDKN